MNFALPEDPKERTKWIAIIVAVSILAVGAVVFSLIKLNDAKKVNRKKIAELNEKINKADKAISTGKQDMIDNETIAADIKNISEKYLIHPKLGNYQLVARDIVERTARELRITLDPVKEIGLEEILYPGKKGEFKVYKARVTMFCGLHELERLLYLFEKRNPYLCVGVISITSQPKDDVYKHSVMLELAWPVWADEEMGAKIEAQLKQLEEEKTKVTNTMAAVTNETTKAK